MTSKAVSRSCEDIDEATLSYAEIKAVATGNPLIREKMEVDNDVQRLKLLKASYDNQRYGLQDNFMIKYPKLIKTATEKLANVREDIKARDKELANVRQAKPLQSVSSTALSFWWKRISSVSTIWCFVERRNTRQNFPQVRWEVW